MAEWVEWLTYDHVPVTAVGSSPTLEAKRFHGGKPSGWLADGRQFFSSVDFDIESVTEVR